ncbi:hypothetical protein STRIP9103_07923 [Streptomyces ipomoeae 91-03]|uniref:Uncharacterized protein n=1 Tax=Streptomyces ipomoeae 91-03 TaxID=698759 RepID=L1KR70_9ACTN|nr:hypothetical protein STRIP9103_07923 [Streptomyces ipomoeae 91-03]
MIEGRTARRHSALSGSSPRPASTPGLSPGLPSCTGFERTGGILHFTLVIDHV